jgi:hypothetical protein
MLALGRFVIGLLLLKTIEEIIIKTVFEKLV